MINQSIFGYKSFLVINFVYYCYWTRLMQSQDWLRGRNLEEGFRSSSKYDFWKNSALVNYESKTGYLMFYLDYLFSMYS